MDGNYVVHDISSDEDVTFDWSSTEGRNNDNFDWNNLMVNLQSGTGKDQNFDKGYDSDDVVVVREVLPNPKRAKKASVVSKLVTQDLEDDDDCVVLDGDPDKLAAVENSGTNSGGDSDDLVIVGEKGQVACRDYPHPRHLCVNFPFDSTLHSNFCKQCHCYVCDSPAPCGNWGNGNLMIDHCHASDKEELWNSERERAKLEKSAPIASSTNTSFWRDLLKQIPTPPSVTAQNSGIHSCHPVQSPSFGIPNIIRSQRAKGTILGYTSHTSTFKRTNRPSLSGYRNAYAANLAGIRRASAQASVRHLHEFQTGFIHGEVNLNTLESSSESSVTQIASPSTPVQPCPQRLAPVSCTTEGNTSHVQREQELPLIEEKPSYDMNSDLYNMGVDTQFLNDLPPFDFEDVQLVCDMDQIWPLF